MYYTKRSFTQPIIEVSLSCIAINTLYKEQRISNKAVRPDETDASGKTCQCPRSFIVKEQELRHQQVVLRGLQVFFPVVDKSVGG